MAKKKRSIKRKNRKTMRKNNHYVIDKVVTPI